MTPLDIDLLLTALISVLVLVALIVSRLKMHPLLALLVVSVGVGFATGMEPDGIVSHLVTGAGKTLGAVGVVIALGAMLGKILADAGVTEQIAAVILKRTTDRMIPWAMMMVAFVIGIPMFFEVGLVIMLPLIFSVARKLESQARFKGSAYVYVGVPVIAALAAMHGMVPPHPGPLTAIAALKTSVGPTMLYGFLAAIPAMILGGPLYGAFISPRMSTRPDQVLLDQFTLAEKADDKPSPSVYLGVLAALLPAILMLIHAVAEMVLAKDNALLKMAGFLGNPLIAMLLGVLFAGASLVLARGGDAGQLRVAGQEPQANRLDHHDHRRRRCLSGTADQRQGGRCDCAPDSAVGVPSADPRLVDRHVAFGVYRFRHGRYRGGCRLAGAAGRC
jgi:GntP family gluconate:H+ symporter